MNIFSIDYVIRQEVILLENLKFEKLSTFKLEFINIFYSGSNSHFILRLDNYESFVHIY